MRRNRVGLRLLAGVATLAAMSIAPAVAQAQTGLVAAYGFEESSGTSVVDSSAGGHAGTISGATRSTAGRFGGALSFDGVNDWVTVPDANAFDFTGMTLEAWVNPSLSAGAWRTVMMKEQPAHMAYALYSAEDTNRPSVHFFSTFGSEEDARGTASLPLNTWTHLAATFDGAVLRLYVNGTQVGTRNSPRTIVTSGGPFRIGGNAVWNEFFKGLIDEVRVYNRPLTAGEIQLDMGTPVVNPDTTPPTGGTPDACGWGTLISDVVPVRVAASDDRGAIASIELLFDDQRLGLVLGSDRHSFDLNSRLYANGVHTLRSVVRDAAGNEATWSCEVTIANVPYSVDFTAPEDGSTVGGTVTLAAAPKKGDAPTTSVDVEFELDGETIGEVDREAPYELAWDTTPVAAGPHTLTVKVYDRAINQAVAAESIDVVVDQTDTTPPGPPTGLTAEVTTDDVRLTWAAAGGGATEYRVHRSSTADFTPSDDNLIATRTTLSHSDADRPAGTHHYKVVAVDAAGNRSAPSNEVSATVLPDTTPPTGGIPDACSWGTPISDSVPVRVFADDDRGTIASMELLLDDQRVGLVLSSSRHWFDLFSFRYANGVHTLRTIVRDPAGNETTQSCEITIHNDTYTVNFTSPADDATVGGTVTFAVAPRKGDAPTAAVGIQFKVDGQDVGVADRQAPYELTWDSTTVSEGEHTVSAELTAGLWHDLRATESIEVVVDQTDAVAPTVPGDLTASVDDDDVDLSWAASSDNRAVVRYAVHRSTSAGFTPTAETLIGTPTGTTLSDPDRVPGTHHYKVLAEDAAGNLSEPSDEADATVAPDATAPSVTVGVGAGAGQCGITVSGTIRVAASAADSRGIASLQLRLDGQDLGAETTEPAIERQWDTRTAADGTHAITAVAVDAAGNATTSTACAVTVGNAPTGLVASYGFDEASGGSVADGSGEGHVGTISGAARSAAGKFGGALSFDGVNDWVTVPHATDLNLTRMTLEAWVRPSQSAGSWRTVLMKEQPSHMGYALYSAEDTNRPSVHFFSTFGSEEDARGTASLPLNTWTHLAATFDGAVLRLYVNGTQVGSRNSPRTIVASGGPLRIGGNAVWNEYFKGLIDEVRVYDRALSPAELAADRDRPVG